MRQVLHCTLNYGLGTIFTRLTVSTKRDLRFVDQANSLIVFIYQQLSSVILNSKQLLIINVQAGGSSNAP